MDGSKLFCNKIHPVTNEPCDGEIDYDAGFNHLVCTRCGKIYLATDLKDNSIDNKIIIKGGNQMKVELRVGDKIVGRPIPTNEVMKPKRKTFENKAGLVVKISGGNIAEKTKTPEADKKPEGEKKSYKPKTYNSNSATANNENSSSSKKENLSEAIDKIESSTESKFIPKHEETVSKAEDAVELSDNNSNEQVDEDIEVAEDPFDVYDSKYEDEEGEFQSRQPIRKKTIARDASGKFVSTKNKKNNRVPSK